MGDCLLWAITFKITEMANIFGPLSTKMSWDTIWPIFLQTHLVTLLRTSMIRR
jgi:hypothetical protein